MHGTVLPSRLRRRAQAIAAFPAIAAARIIAIAT